MATSPDSQYWEEDCQKYNTSNPIVAPPPLVVTPEPRKASPLLGRMRIITHHTSILNLFNASLVGLVFASTPTGSKVWTIGANNMTRLLFNRVFPNIAHRGSFSSFSLQSKRVVLASDYDSGDPASMKFCTRAVKHRIAKLHKI